MSLETDFVSLAKAKEQAKALATSIADQEAKLIAKMDAAGLDRISAGDGLDGTLVRAERVVIDPAELEARLTKPQWAKVTRLVLDNEKLEAMVVVGAIKPDVIAAASEVKVNKPYLRVNGSVAKLVQNTIEAAPAPRRVVVKAARP